jgi:uncharacterized membrane protein
MIEETCNRPPAATGGRMGWLDTARGIALTAMASYHFMWDLGDFGYIDAAFPATGWPKIYARTIASTFLFLAGFSLVLGHGRMIRWRSFGIRLGKIAAAAAAVSLASYFFMPQGLIFFGILHDIAIASLIGLIFLRAPPIVTALAAVAALLAPFYLTSEAFNTPLLWWTGLSPRTRASFDFVPILPWLCAFLMGIAIARLPPLMDWLRQNAGGGNAKNRWKQPFAFLGRHSLVFYLVHQPILIAFLYCVSLIHPAPTPDPAAGYVKSCEVSCGASQDAPFCKKFCGCTLEQLKAQDLFASFQSGAISAGKDERIKRIAVECSSQSY